MSAIWHLFRESLAVPCTVEIEQTGECLHAHVALEGVDVRPGDEVLVHDAPQRIGFGMRIQCRRMATVHRASRLERAWVRVTAPLGLAALCEVGFLARRLP